jgi:predicted nucleic acid-binding protein
VVLALPPAAVLDANVLVPAALRDLLLNLGEAGLIVCLWSADILDETFRSIAARRPDLRTEQLARNREVMERAFDGAAITGYEHHIPALSLPDPDDRHVLAAAIEGGADHIVTRDAAGFPLDALAAHGVERRSPDELVNELIDAHGPEAVRAVLRHQAAAMRRPPMTVAEIIDRLADPSHGLPTAMGRLALP